MTKITILAVDLKEWVYEATQYYYNRDYYRVYEGNGTAYTFPLRNIIRIKEENV